MKYFCAIHRVRLDAAILQKAKTFAAQVTATTPYADSHQHSAAKIEDDHFISKIGEEAARHMLSKYASVVGPDYAIYTGKQKSWAPDLYVDGVALAVKTQKRTTAQRFGLSWTFQAGAARHDAILTKPDAWVAFVAYDDIAGNICYVYPPFQMKELTLAEPVLDKLKGCKKVVYARTLPMHR